MTKISFVNKSSFKTLILGLAEGFNLKTNLSLDNDLRKIIEDVAENRDFTGKAGQMIAVAIPHSSYKTIILLGVGEVEKFNQLNAIKLGGKILNAIKGQKILDASIIIENRLLQKEEALICANIAYGSHLRKYTFDKYKSAEKLKDKFVVNNLEIVTEKNKEAQDLYLAEIKPVAESIDFSRDLISEPPNVIYPESFAKRVQQDFKSLKVRVEVLSVKQMADLGMNALLGVGQGSSKESKLLVMHYEGGNKKDAPLAFVGKGVTFDTGGISIKPSANMEDMKYDMSGAAIVTGLMKALASRKAKVNVVAIAGLVENMPDGNAQRPADVVKSMSGQTIEILNTDAEGRLVLADALWYCQDRFKPKLMIDLATLTGAMIIALGTHHAGIFSNDEELEKSLIKAGKIVDEKLWPLPLSDDYDKMVDSCIADVRNTGNGKGAGSITAAQFLKRFVNNVPWAHLDIAGVSWADKDTDFHPAGATGYGIRLLNEFVKAYEK